jgi:hypothetical protein
VGGAFEFAPNTPEMKDENGRQRKLIIFTEHRDTLDYLADKIRNSVCNGAQEAVVMIHGGVKREERRKVQELFRNDPVVRVLIATDAAGEGVNLQNANLMVNYDLPWNPNRLEQRFGRIHRIGQTEVCHLWNMVASGTREGDVFQRLFEKLEIERAALGGRVFDILGEVFENKSLKDLLIEAIRYGNDPAVRQSLLQAVEGALDTQHLQAIIERNALNEDLMDANRLFKVKDEMDKAEARKLQPYFIRAFFQQAFTQLGGELRQRESGRYEIGHVPGLIRDRDRLITGRDRRYNEPVLRRYERVCFEKQFVRLQDRAGASMASLIHAGHPLMQSVTDVMLERHRGKLKEGAVLVDPTDMGLTPKLMFIIDHSIKEGFDNSQITSRRMQFIRIDENGNATEAGWAPHLDMRSVSKDELSLVQDVVQAQWLNTNHEPKALAHAAQHLVPAHFDEIKTRRERTVDKTMTAIRDRLTKEIQFWSDRYDRLKDDMAAGKDVRLNLENVRRTIDDLTSRLQTRLSELQAKRTVISATPVLPAGLLAQRAGDQTWTPDAEARARVELVAMQAVMRAEIGMGNEVKDVSALKCGWDITSTPPMVDGKMPVVRHIEVKGRAKGQSTITVTRNEVMYGLNQQDKFVLAIVLVEGESHEGPYYVRNPFTQEPDWAVTSVNLDLPQLLTRAS